MKVRVPLDKAHLEVVIPAALESATQILRSLPAEPLADPSRAVEEALDRPLGAPPLAELARGKKNVVVVVSDKTRPAPNRLLLPPLLARLERAGAPRAGVTILVATGMHGASEPEALAAMLGEEVLNHYRVVNHDCRDQASLQKVSEFAGYPIEVNRLFTAAELKIVTGLIEPHPFAGFSGGGKSVIPGLAGFASMRYLHSYAMLEEPGVRSLKLNGNPFQERVRDICQGLGVDFMANLTMDHDRRVTGVFAGALPTAHDAGCEFSRAASLVSLPHGADMVITNGGGAPMDLNLYQSTKGLMAAAGLVKPGGSLLLVTSAREGLGSREYVELLKSVGGAKGFRERFSDPSNFVIDQWGAQAYFQVAEKVGRILLYSPNVSREQADLFGMEKITSLDGPLAELAAKGGSLAVLSEGPYVVGKTA